MSLHKDLLQLIFLEFDHGHDMLNFSELNRRSQQIFHQQIKVIHKPKTTYNHERKYMQNNHGCGHGISRRWYSSGQLSNEGHKYKGLSHGVCRSWYENGQLFDEINWIHGDPEMYRRWNSLGQLLYEHNYFHDSQIEK